MLILMFIPNACSNQQSESIGPDKGLVPNKQQGIIWNNDDIV